jgi:hypothetical protein
LVKIKKYHVYYLRFTIDTCEIRHICYKSPYKLASVLNENLSLCRVIKIRRGLMSCDTNSASGATAPNPYPGRGPRTEQGRANQIAGASEGAIAQWEEARAQGKTRLGELTPEGRANISAANKGRAKSPEQRLKMSLSHLQVEERKRLDRDLARINEVCGIRAPLYQQGADI